MLTAIWITAAALYLAFHAWYVGFRGKLTPAEVDAYCERLKAHWDEARVAMVRKWLSADTGRDFVMLNVLRLNRQTKTGEPAHKMLQKYQQPFMRSILPRASHPIFFGRASAPSLELWGIDNADDWDFGALVRYRSRRDFVEVLLSDELHRIRSFKLDSLQKTFAFPADPMRILPGGVRLVAPLLIVALASLASVAALLAG